MIDVTIPKSKWLRGKSPDNMVVLLNEAGAGCILGHILLASGFPKDDLLGKYAISRLPDHLVQRYCPEPLFSVLSFSEKTTGSVHSCRLVDVNDDDAIEDDEREDKLTLFCEPLGIALRFVEDEPHARQQGMAQ